MDNVKKEKQVKKEKKSILEFKKIEISLEELEKKSIDEQAEYLDDILSKIYSKKDVTPIRKYSLRIIKLSCDPKDNKIHLPYSVIVEKKGTKLYINVYNKKPIILLLVGLLILFLAILGSSYSAINYSIIKNLNKDIDGDGIPDINLDLNKDRIAEVNIDTNNNDQPDLNIDYKGNKKPIFNIDTNNDGVANFNLMNQDINKDGICDLNCDTDKDGWPNINLDLDGDGIADIELDTNNDGVADLNFDMDKDMVCDLHCDTNNDKKCDKFCLTSTELEKVDPIGSGSSSTVGSNKTSITSDQLILEYEEENTFFITNIYPEDQPNYINKIPTKKFKVVNKSSLYVSYNLRWVITENTFVSDNFKYKINSTLNGASFDFVTAPKESSSLATNIIIPPFSTQEYSVDFKLEGIGEKQNYDQGKTFAGYIEIYLDNN